MNTEELIHRLSEDLSPTPQIWSFWRVVVIWLVVSIGYVSMMILLLGPLRTGVAAQLELPSRFSTEMLFGGAALVFWAIAALAESIPGRYRRWPIRLSWFFFIAWLLHFVVGYVSPSLEPSMLGKREHCALEAYLYSLPPTLLMYWMQRRRFPLKPIRAAVYGAVAAALLPALAMQVACMYEPTHILQNHVFPILVLASVVGVVSFGIVRFSKTTSAERH